MSAFQPGDYRRTADLRAVTDDDLNVDEYSEVSRGADDGAWVQVWIWISDKEVEASMAPKPSKRKKS